MKLIVITAIAFLQTSVLNAQTSNIKTVKETISTNTNLTKTGNLNLETTDLNAVVRNFKAKNEPIDNVVLTLKGNHKATAEKCFQALVTGGYDTLSSGKSTATSYALNLANTFRMFPFALSTSGSTNVNKAGVNLRIRITRHAFSTSTFEQLLDNVKGMIFSKKTLFEEMCKLYALSDLQIAQKGLTYYNSRLLIEANEPYPNAAQTYDAIVYARPSTTHFSAYATILKNGFDIIETARTLTPGTFSRTGVASDNVAVCFRSNMPTNTSVTSPFQAMQLQINSINDTATSLLNNTECYRLFTERMRQQNVSRQTMYTWLKCNTECYPIGSSLCSPAIENHINSLLNQAGYTSGSK